MNACIITIGNELVQGFTIDSNSSWIANTLISYKIDIKKIISIPDHHEQIIFETKNILEEKYDYIFITGGLGPTHDDITKKAFSEIINDELVLDEE